MKKILLSLSAIAIVGVIAVSATTALFSDTETSTGNTISAGTLDLTVGGNDGTNSVFFNVTDAKPGQSGTQTYALVNTGSIDGTLDVSGITITGDEGSTPEPETEKNAGSELTAHLTVTVTVGGTELYTGPLNALALTGLPIDLLKTESKNMTVAWSWNLDSENDNNAMGDTAVLGFNIVLNQKN